MLTLKHPYHTADKCSHNRRWAFRTIIKHRASSKSQQNKLTSSDRPLTRSSSTREISHKMKTIIPTAVKENPTKGKHSNVKHDHTNIHSSSVSASSRSSRSTGSLPWATRRTHMSSGWAFYSRMASTQKSGTALKVVMWDIHKDRGKPWRLHHRSCLARYPVWRGFWWNLEIFVSLDIGPGNRTQASVLTCGRTTSYATETVSSLDTVTVA